METVEFVEYTEEFLDLSWEWLNDPEIKALTMTPDFTREQQLAFFRGIPTRTDFRIFGMVVNGEKAGVTGLKNIRSGIDAEFWCYIGLRKYWGSGLSSRIYLQAENEGKKHGVSEIYLKSAKFNVRSVRAWEKMGFSVKEEFPEYFLMAKKVEA